MLAGPAGNLRDVRQHAVSRLAFSHQPIILCWKIHTITVAKPSYRLVKNNKPLKWMCKHYSWNILQGTNDTIHKCHIVRVNGCTGIGLLHRNRTWWQVCVCFTERERYPCLLIFCACSVALLLAAEHHQGWSISSFGPLPTHCLLLKAEECRLLNWTSPATVIHLCWLIEHL